MLNCRPMGVQLLRFVVFWALNMLLLWVASSLFATPCGSTRCMRSILSGLLFGIAHAVLKPILVILTLPITVLTLGLFLLVINALLLLLVAWLVPGFHVAGFWPAAGVGLFISVFSFALSLLFQRGRTAPMSAAGPPGLVRRVLLPFAFAYVLSYLYRTVNAVIAPDLVAAVRAVASAAGPAHQRVLSDLRGIPASARACCSTASARAAPTRPCWWSRPAAPCCSPRPAACLP